MFSEESGTQSVSCHVIAHRNTQSLEPMIHAQILTDVRTHQDLAAVTKPATAVFPRQDKRKRLTANATFRHQRCYLIFLRHVTITLQQQKKIHMLRKHWGKCQLKRKNWRIIHHETKQAGRLINMKLFSLWKQRSVQKEGKWAGMASNYLHSRR